MNHREKTAIKKLPVNIPPITSYPHHANFLSIILNSEDSYNWFYNHYIHIESPALKTLEKKYFGLDFCNPAFIWDICPFIKKSLIGREFINNKWDSFTDYALFCLENNYYIYLYLDSYYISIHPFFNESHTGHNTFIFGYDLEKKVFHAADFFKNFKYSYEEVPFDDIETAYQNFHQVNRKCQFDEVMMIQLNQDFKYNFDVPYFIDSINIFLQGSNPRLIYRNPNFQQTEEYSGYGIETYDILKKYLQIIMEGNSLQYLLRTIKKNSIDKRNFFVLWEHKKVMLSRIEFLGQKNILLNHESLLESYKSIFQGFNALSNMIVKYTIVNDKKILEEVILQLDKLKKKEIQALNDILNNINKDYQNGVTYQKPL